MTKTPGPAARPSRHPALAALDVIVGLAFMLTGLGIAFVVIATSLQFPLLLGNCTQECAPGLLNALVVVIIAVTVLAWALGAGFFIVRAFQKRVAWFWPTIAFAAIVVVFWVGTALVSLSIPGAAS